MLGTYLATVAVFAAAAVVGQAIFRACGHRAWSWLAPAVGMAALMPLAWWLVRLPGEGTTAGLLLIAIVLAAGAYLRGSVGGLGDAARIGLPVVAVALVAGSLPFIVEGRFGILGTGLNPDMSQHLFAADRLAESGSERLISSGYPLGPHSLAVAVSALGPSLVHAFDGIVLATAISAALAPLALLAGLPPARRVGGALLVGFAYMTAAYLTQGAFKETLQALFLLAFAIGLGEAWHGRLAGGGRWRFVPLAVLAVGSVYVYSFPGVLWLGGAAALWALTELVLAGRGGWWERSRRMARRALRPALYALGLFALAIAPEATRIVDFAGFETFDPAGEGLGNLFNPLSPLEALGVWPSGDFRLDPGDGAAPAIVYYLGGALGLVALGFGLWWWLRRGERAVVCALAIAVALVAYAHVAGTPYQEAKAIALVAPLAMLVSVRALAEAAPTAAQVRRILRRRGIAALFPRSARTARLRLALATLAASFAGAAALCSLAALANGPVGPSSYSPALTELRPLDGATLVLAPEAVLADEHGRDYLVWELRGGEVCVEAEEGQPPGPPPPGVHQVIVFGDAAEPPFEGTDAGRRIGPYTLWGIPDPTPGESGCPFVSDGQRAEPGAAQSRD